MDINKKTIGEFREDFKVAVSILEEQYGVAIDFGRISFNAKTFSGKVTIENVGDVPAGQNVEQAKFANNAGRFGFTAEDYGKNVRINGKSHKFYGFNTNARKNFCKIRETISGKEYVTDAETIRQFS
jgi:hypothetical protein